MSRLERFLGKSKKFNIGGEEIEIRPLAVKHLDVLMKLGDKEKSAEAMKKLILLTLQRSFPEENIETLEEFSIEFLNDLVNAIIEVNNIEVPEKMKKEAINKLPLG